MRSSSYDSNPRSCAIMGSHVMPNMGPNKWSDDSSDCTGRSGMLELTRNDLLSINYDVTWSGGVQTLGRVLLWDRIVCLIRDPNSGRTIVLTAQIDRGCLN